MERWEIHQKFNQTIEPIEAFSEILADLVCSESVELEGNGHILKNLNSIFLLVSKNARRKTEEILDELQETMESD